MRNLKNVLVAACLILTGGTAMAQTDSTMKRTTRGTVNTQDTSRYNRDGHYRAPDSLRMGRDNKSRNDSMYHDQMNRNKKTYPDSLHKVPQNH